ncbi:4-(cytidine 5'-diphospho)-2-C-methyl-D-erythritol kinase [soil metagenome]
MKYLAPAKLNLNLLVSRVDDSGFHPLRSLVQTIEWCDVLEAEEADTDELELVGISVPDGGDNLVLKALTGLRALIEIPPVAFRLEKRIPPEAGLGGGSADAAAALIAGCDIVGADHDKAELVAPEIGSDVSFPLVGGTAEMTGYGELIESVPALESIAFAVVVPEFGLSTPEVYRRWDEIGEPVGFEVPDRFLPPVLRHSYPIRNDLYRAAVDVEPALGDFVSDTARLWDTAVMMTGSGSACFGFFPSEEDAVLAASVVPATRAATGAAVRPKGVERVE